MGALSYHALDIFGPHDTAATHSLKHFVLLLHHIPRGVKGAEKSLYPVFFFVNDKSCRKIQPAYTPQIHRLLLPRRLERSLKLGNLMPTLGALISRAGQSRNTATSVHSHTFGGEGKLPHSLMQAADTQGLLYSTCQLKGSYLVYNPHPYRNSVSEPQTSVLRKPLPPGGRVCLISSAPKERRSECEQ